jgi:hypothetical protein
MAYRWLDIYFFRNDIDLEGRLEYLSRAIMSAKSCNVRPSSISDGEFLHELEEKLEVMGHNIWHCCKNGIVISYTPSYAISL